MYTIKKLGDGKESGSGEKGTRCQERKRKKFFESDYQARSQEIKKSIYFIRFLDIGPLFKIFSVPKFTINKYCDSILCYRNIR